MCAKEEDREKRRGRSMSDIKLKTFEKMSGIELLVFLLLSMGSGVMVGIGGISSLIANALLGEIGRLVGATLFSLGIFAIVTYNMKLFTGMVAEIPNLGIKNCWRLPVCFIGNAFGVAFVALLAYYSPVSETVVHQSKVLIGTKLAFDDWAIRAFCSSILCGILITISVKSRRYATQKGMSATLGVVFPIIVFAFCGFDHSVANMLYLFYFGEISWRVVGYIFIAFSGNLIGGVIFPIVSKLREYTEKKKAERQESKN
ncbi:MAG: formate/nitrite transporter family protein [Clostridiales bacterium]|nr:formate/nitrite transporter family protein [Clostridiales bacterium]